MATKAATRVITNRKGQELVTHFTDKEAFDELERLVRLGEREGFGRNLVSQCKKNGLSEEQFWWVHKLAMPEKPPITLEAGRIVEAFYRGMDNGVKSRNAKITLVSPAGKRVVLGMAGQRSKYYGDIWVTDDRPYPGNTLYGRIDHVYNQFTGRDVPEDVIQLLKDVDDETIKYLPW